MTIEPIKMPKWGLAMEEGKIVEWWAAEGAEVADGEDLVDIETAKITNVCEAHKSGILRRIVAQPGETLPVGALIGVLADADVSDADIDAFIADFASNFVPGEADDDDAGLEITNVDVYGRSLRVGVMGKDTDGTPVVLLHGFGGDLNNWMLVQPALAAEHPVYAIELPGHGQSSKDVADGKLNTLAAGIVAAIKSLDLEKVNLVGHSLGGAIAIEVAGQLNGVVSSLSLVCPASLPGGDLNSTYLDGFVSARRARDLREPAKLLFANEDMVSRDMLEDLIKTKRLDGAEAALTKIKDNLKGDDPAYADLGNQLEKIDAPITIMSSKTDQIVGAPDESALPASVTLHWLDSVGHMPHLEASDDVVKILKTVI
ncbi:MAG: acetoin dehydrogenase dihydrolipoyllysine-residue acetyltransferase subunit [Pseudomonadota bacterium]